MSAPGTVDALLPLSLLEAVRTVDAPLDDQDAEYVPELRNKRLGLSEPIYAQIRRYTLAARRSQRTPHDEAVAIARLIGRRSDAAAVFASAGRILARQSYETASTNGSAGDSRPSIAARAAAGPSAGAPDREAVPQRRYLARWRIAIASSAGIRNSQFSAQGARMRVL